MNMDQIKERVAQLDKDPGWYQNIDLKNGVQTKTRKVWGEELDHPKIRWKAVEPGFPESFTGKSVLDVGCNAGFFSFVAAERGAGYVCGIDANEKYIAQARFANEIRGDNVDFRALRIQQLPSLNRKFDITICIGLLYHLGDIYGAIKSISAMTTEMAIVESAIHPDDNELPLVRVATQEGKLPGVWHPNIAALEALFKLCGFKRTVKLFKAGGRGGILAYK
jgi:2-polyprenyl-3-methyl-5-hydroxy-6-metoxy-1,4-benzoquinol methylase